MDTTGRDDVRAPIQSAMRQLLQRTSTIVRSRRPSLRPDTAARAPAQTEPIGTPRPPVSSSSRWPAWLKTLSLDRTTVAASIEGSSLRVVSVVKERVVGWASIPLASNLVRNGQIGDPADLGDVIDEAFARLNLPRQRVAWALPGFQVATRLVDLPGLRGKQLREAIAEEVEQSLGAAADNSYLFWQRLDGRIRGRHVFVLAVPKSTVLAALEALEAADIRPHTMDLRPLALARAVGRADAVVANMEEGSLDVVVVANTVPTVLRSIPLPGAATNQEAAQNRLVDEIDRALSYHDDAHPNHPLDADAPLYLTGRLATGIALAEKIRAVTGHPIGRLSTSISYPPDFPIGEYLVNLGLALKRS
jgi:hypothetical protein